MFNKNHIIPDRVLTSYIPLDTAGFLKKIGSPLAAFSVDNVTVSSLIESACTEAAIDPRFIITKLQVEQSLLFKQPTKESLDWAMGYGCPDSGPKQEEYRGFARQIKAAAKGIKGYLAPSNPLYVGKYVNKEWNVSDGVVVCKNIATAALYRYTPWIGDRDSQGYKAPFGNFLFYRVWTGLFGAINLDESHPPQPTTQGWRLIAPPDNWREPIPLQDNDVERFVILAKRLNLRMTKDTQRRKLYLGLPLKDTPPPEPDVKRVTYPSGESFPIVDGSPWAASHSTYWAPHPEVAAPLIRLTAESRKRKLSDHFSLGEFACQDPAYEYIRVHPKLIVKLEEIRKQAGSRPIRVTSAHRPYPYNAAISGAVDNSYHIDGAAADIYIDALTVRELYNIADKIISTGGGVGAYYNDGFVHVDIRGYESRW